MVKKVRRYVIFMLFTLCCSLLSMGRHQTPQGKSQLKFGFSSAEAKCCKPGAFLDSDGKCCMTDFYSDDGRCY